MSQLSAPLLRFSLLAALLALAAALVVLHGLRGLLVAAIAGAALMALTSKTWRRAENFLVAFTGSRRRSYALLLGLLITIVAAANIVTLVH